MNRHRSGWALGALLALLGCSDGTGLNVPVASVEVVPLTAQVRVGATLRLTATPRDSSGTPLSGRPVTWASSALARATVDSTGLVMGVSPGSVTITATAEGVSGSASLTVTPGPATRLAFAVQPVSTGAGTTLAPVEVTARDAQGNTATSFSGSVSLALVAGPAGATLSGNTTVAATAGVATFSGISVAQSGTGYRLSATAGGLTPDTSTGFTIVPGPAARTAFVVEPSNVAAGASITPAVQIAVEDAYGNVVASFSGDVTIAIGTNPVGGTLTGTATRAAVNGVASFTDLAIDKAGTGYTLQAVATSLIAGTSTSFTVSAGTATQLAIAIPPSSSAQSGMAFLQQPVIQVEDVSGNAVGQSGVLITASIASGPGGATLSNFTATTSGSGTATFSGLALTGAVGSYTLHFGAGTLNPAITGTITLSAGQGTQLGITIPPSSTAQSAVAFPQQPVIQIQDASGNAVKQSGTLVTATITSGPAGATLSNDTATTDTSGAADFSGLEISGSTGSYTLGFGAPGLTSDTSGPITLSAGTPAGLAITTQAANGAQSGVAFTQQPVVQLQDVSGNAVSQSGVQVTATVATSPPGSTPTLSNAIATTDNNGAAAFSGLAINGQVGYYTLSFGASGLTPVTSNTIALLAGPVAQLAIVIQPSSAAQSGQAFAQQPAVQLQDATGNPVSTSGTAITAEIASGPSGGALTNATANTSNGLATFSGLTLTGTAGSYRLRFTSGSLAPDTSMAITLSAGTASKLVITTEPSSSASSGQAFAQQPVVQLQDANGNPVTTSGTPITAEIASGPGGGALTNATANTSNGVATFSGLTLTGTAGNYRLRFTSGSLAPDTSTTIALSAGAAAQLVITTEPSSGASSGQAFAQQPVVQLQDANGNLVTTSGTPIVAEIASGPGGGSLTNATANTSNGVASFSGLTLTGTAGNYRLRFTSGSLMPDTSTTIALSAGTATRLVITTEPSSSDSSGQAFAQQPAVQLQDASGNPVSTSGTPIAAEIASGPGGGSLTNATANTNGSGLATFSGLTLTGTAGSYRLRFTSGSLTPDTSTTITLSAGTATQLVIATEPSSSASSGQSFAQQPAVQLEDASGNPVGTANTTITAAIASGPSGASLSNPTANTSSSGLATFSGLVLTGTAGSYRLRFTSGSLTPDTSIAITLSAGAAKKLAFDQEPTSTTAGTAISPAVTVRILDSLGNLTTSNASVSLAITTGTGTNGAHLSGGASVSVNANNGVATFNSLTIDSAGTGYTLAATSGTLAGATSTAFDITVGGVDADKSTLTISTDTIGQCLNPCDPVKNGAATVTVQARDSGGNAVSGATVALSASPASTDSNRFTNPGPSGSTDGSGVFTANFNSAQALVNKTISATVGGRLLTQTRTVYVMPVLVGAGDISDCTRASDDSTARLLDSIPGTVFADGDDVYPSGTSADFTLCYDPNWGRHKARTVPVLGNHEYDSSATAAGYFTYYGSAADPLGNGIGYYSFDISTWHIVVLNSEPAGTASNQLTWLQGDLAATNQKCILALWHEPLFTSGPSGGATQTRRLWNALQNVGADLVINGHDHMYERFALQDSLGNADPTGIREIIVGTGGGETHANFGTIAANDEANDMNNYSRGVLRLTLYADSYRWEFIPAAGFGTYTDAGTGTCH